ncbi:MAG TPA: asparaginase [Candidatus Izemoplasmatales bacterium]|nr:asparaginase [Candidatus Izemoplasmatales bacterium]
MIFTGGTITMKMENEHHSVVPALSASDIMSSLLTSFNECNLKTIEYCQLPSPSITPDIMLGISKLIDELSQQDDVTGFVVVHGTDVLEETAFFLDTVLETKKPVVVTGSMKSSSDLGYDGINNLVSSILVCLSKEAVGKGVLVVLNDQINAASEVTKTNTLSLDTFKSLDYGPLGIVDTHRVIFYRSVNYQRPILHVQDIEENVHLVKVCSGMDDKILDYLIDTLDAKGIVLEALGRGNVPPAMLPGIRKAIAKHVPVIITSRCPSGRVLDTYGYEGGGKHLTTLGCIIAPNLNGQKARILLMIALKKCNDIAQLKQIFGR